MGIPIGNGCELVVADVAVSEPEIKCATGAQSRWVTLDIGESMETLFILPFSLEKLVEIRLEKWELSVSEKQAGKSFLQGTCTNKTESKHIKNDRIQHI